MSLWIFFMSQHLGGRKGKACNTLGAIGWHPDSPSIWLYISIANRAFGWLTPNGARPKILLGLPQCLGVPLLYWPHRGHCLSHMLVCVRACMCLCSAFCIAFNKVVQKRVQKSKPISFDVFLNQDTTFFLGVFKFQNHQKHPPPRSWKRPMWVLTTSQTTPKKHRTVYYDQYNNFEKVVQTSIPPPLSKLRPCPSYSRRRDRIKLVPNFNSVPNVVQPHKTWVSQICQSHRVMDTFVVSVCPLEPTPFLSPLLQVMILVTPMMPPLNLFGLRLPEVCGEWPMSLMGSCILQETTCKAVSFPRT